MYHRREIKSLLHLKSVCYTQKLYSNFTTKPQEKQDGFKHQLNPVKYVPVPYSAKPTNICQLIYQALPSQRLSCFFCFKVVANYNLQPHNDSKSNKFLVHKTIY